MFGFKKKKTNESAPAKDLLSGARVTVMPQAFYGGKDPVVYFETSKPTKQHVVKSVVDPTKKTVPLLPNNKAILSDKKFFIIGILVLFLVCMIGASAYVFRGYIFSVLLPKKAESNPKNVVIQQNSTTDIPPLPVKNVTSTDGEVVVKTSSTTTDSVATKQVVPEQLGQFPEQNLANTVDLDADQLTDVEEGSFSTDPGSSDTDQDGYYDGLEVFNLYNPKGFAPVKIIDSGLVKEYTSSNWRYSIYYPVNWQSAEVDNDGNQVIFSALNGDFIEVHAFLKSAGQSFTDWFGVTVSNEQFSDLTPIKNRFGVQGYERKDHLVSYFPIDTKIFVIIYHPSTPGPINYRHIMMMATQSFRGDKNTFEIPDQVVLPKEGSGATANQP